MSLPELPPLDPDLDALLDAERSRPPADPAVSARVLSRVMATVGPPGAGGGGGRSGAAAGSLLKPILVGAALGGVVAAGVVAAPDRDVRIAQPPAPIVATFVSSASARVDRAPPPPAPSAAGPASALPPPPPASRSATPLPEESLAAERRILDEAQRALAEGRPGTALDALGRHAGAFPRGRLGEEREALAIRALARSGRSDEARARAARFREAYPQSILLPAIESAVGTIP